MSSGRGELSALPRRDRRRLDSDEWPSTGGWWVGGVFIGRQPIPKAEASLSIYASAGEERGPALVECWQRFWRGGFAVHVDVNVPGRGFCVGPFDVRVDSTHGEPDWQSNRVVPAVGVAISLKVGKTRIVWVPGAAPRPQLAYLCRDADLAIIEVGQTPWPPSEMAWRLDESQARVAGAEAARVWLVDDEGRRLSSARA